jgi:hypothetical protein
VYLLNKQAESILNGGIVTRIAALWAFSEAFMGGILHGFKIPFAGLFLSLVAAICMSLVAIHTSKRGVILSVTLTVLAVKFILSPHTPPMAYVAVLIQGLVGELLFLTRRANRVAAFSLTMFCLLYSAFQHLFVLTIVFGRDFWEALDLFLNGITKTFIKKPQHYSLYLVGFYIGCYFLAGVLGGLLNWRIITTIQSGKMPSIVTNKAIQLHSENFISNSTSKQKKKGKWFYIGVCILVLALICSYTPLFNKTVFSSKAGQIILRGTLIMLVWNFLVSPLLVKWIHKWVSKYKSENASLLTDLVSLFPDMRKLVFISWEEAKASTMLKRVPVFLANTVYLTIYGK